MGIKLKCIRCGGLMKKPAQDFDPVIGLVCDNEDCERFGLLSAVCKKEFEPDIIKPEDKSAN